MMSVAVRLSVEVITSQTKLKNFICLSGYMMMVKVIFRTAQIHLELPFFI